MLLGASVVTVCEIVDLIVYNIARFHQDKKQAKQDRQKREEKHRLPSGLKWKEPLKIQVYPMEPLPIEKEKVDIDI